MNVLGFVGRVVMSKKGHINPKKARKHQKRPNTKRTFK